MSEARDLGRAAAAAALRVVSSAAGRLRNLNEVRLNGGAMIAFGVSIVAFLWHERRVRRAGELARAKALDEFQGNLHALQLAIKLLREYHAENAELLRQLLDSAQISRHGSTTPSPIQEEGPDELDAAVSELPRPPRPTPLTIWDLGSGTKDEEGWNQHHIDWAMNECTREPRELGYHEVFVSEPGECGQHKVYRREIEPSVWIYKRELTFAQIPAPALLRYISTITDDLEPVTSLSNTIARNASSMASVQVKPVAKVSDKRAVTYWRTKINPFLSDRDMVMHEELYRAGLGSGVHGLLLCAGGDHASVPNPCKGAVRIEHYTAQLVLELSETSSQLLGCYFVDLRDVPSIFANKAAEQLGKVANETMFNWLASHHARLQRNGRPT